MIWAAIFLAVFGLAAWGQDTEKVDKQNGVDSLLADMRGDIFYEDQAPNRTVPYASWAIGGLMFLGGVILVASNPSTTPETAAAGTLERPASGTGDLRPCPHCAEDIKRAAIVCRFCKSEVTPAS